MARPFENQYFDKMMISEKPYKALRQSLGLSRESLGQKFGISAHSIRRYETTNKPPLWYYLLLRLSAGDLSYFGARWDNCHIDIFSGRLVTPYDKYKAYWPNELNAKTSGIHQKAAALVADYQDYIAELEQSNGELMRELFKLGHRSGTITRPGDSQKVVSIFG